MTKRKIELSCLRCRNDFHVITHDLVMNPSEDILCPKCRGLSRSASLFACKSCHKPLAPYTSFPLPDLCVECQAIEDKGGKPTRNDAGELCQRCSLLDTPFAPAGWLCPKCHGEDQGLAAEMHKKLGEYAATIDGLTTRNAELLIEIRDMGQSREEAMLRLSKSHDRVMSLQERGDCVRCAGKEEFGWLCPKCHEEMVGWVNDLHAKKKTLEDLFSGAVGMTPDEIAKLTLDELQISLGPDHAFSPPAETPKKIEDIEVKQVSLTKEPFYEKGIKEVQSDDLIKASDERGDLIAQRNASDKVVVIHVKENVEIDIRRFRLPVVIKSKCPRCSKIVELDLEDQYLSYPKVGRNEEFLYHECDDGEDSEWPVPVRLEITISVLDNSGTVCQK